MEATNTSTGPLVPCDDPYATDAYSGTALAGTGLCLSGGGYRAMLFHAGAIWRLHDSGLLGSMDRISSVSGGSIASGVLALAWEQLAVDFNDNERFVRLVIDPIRNLASKTVDIPAIGKSILLAGLASDYVAAAYDKHLFGKKTLQHLPIAPVFVFNATSVQSGALWRFTRSYIRDYRVGEIKSPTLRLSAAVAASSAFPPFLSPAKLPLNPKSFTPKSGKDLQFSPYDENAVLTDGGVYDNLGLETVWKRCAKVLVSDGGGKMAATPYPAYGWLRHSRRVLDVVDNQVRSLRKRQLLDSFTADPRDASFREGAYWGIRSDIDDFNVEDTLPCPFEKTTELADVSTRLANIAPRLQERLINWGYAVCDAAVRKYVDQMVAPPRQFPYPNSEI